MPEIDRCQHPEHDPPNMRVFEPGVYEHECPACGHKSRFIVRAARWMQCNTKLDQRMTSDNTEAWPRG